MLTLDGISHRFESSPMVLNNLHLALPEGQCVLVLGVNGIGKTTLLKIIAGLLTPTTGCVRWTRPIRMGVVLDRSFLFPHLSGIENLKLYQRLYGAVDDRVDWAARTWGLQGFWDAPVRVMSKGQHQRISLARATVHDPEVLILDEPQTALDAESVGLLASYLTDITAAGKLSLVATHDPEYLAHIAQRRIRLHAGHITEVQ
jgi:ABC-type multidrug transport system ATPase subunit